MTIYNIKFVSPEDEFIFSSDALAIPREGEYVALILDAPKTPEWEEDLPGIYNHIKEHISEVLFEVIAVRHEFIRHALHGTDSHLVYVVIMEIEDRDDNEEDDGGGQPSPSVTKEAKKKEKTSTPFVQPETPQSTIIIIDPSKVKH